MWPHARKIQQARLDEAGLSHAKFQFSPDGARYEIEGLRNQEEIDKANRALTGPKED